MRFINKKFGVVVLVAGIFSFGFVLFAHQQVAKDAQNLVWQSINRIPANTVGVVPGTWPGGLYFRNRIDSAAALYQAGKVKWLVVSGDNRRASYNEPREMQQALIAKGVPQSAIYCDYAGFTTLDTVVRAREIFGQTRITIISQRFQNERAIYLAQHYGIQAIGFNAADVPAQEQRLLGTIREYIARARAVLDANLLGRQPHFSGPKMIPGSITAERCP